MTTQGSVFRINRIDKRTIEALAIIPVLEELKSIIPMPDLVAALQKTSEKEAYRRGRAMGTARREAVIAALVN